MHVIDHSTLPRQQETGRQRFAAANAQLGARHLEIWIETLESNARAEFLPLDRERIVLVLAGYGNLQVDGAPQRFHAPCSLMLPSGTEGVAINIGAEPMHLVVTFRSEPLLRSIGPSLAG